MSRGNPVKRVARFWSKVDNGGPTQKNCPQIGACEIWTGARNQDGYGTVNWEGRSQRSHRIVWTLKRGPIPRGMFVLHRCDNPPCVRIDHLFLGNALDNARDTVAKGRVQNMKGEHNPNSILSDEDRRYILLNYVRGRGPHNPGNAVSLAQRFGVSQSRITKIVRKYGNR